MAGLPTRKNLGLRKTAKEGIDRLAAVISMTLFHEFMHHLRWDSKPPPNLSSIITNIPQKKISNFQVAVLTLRMAGKIACFEARKKTVKMQTLSLSWPLLSWLWNGNLHLRKTT